MTDYRKPLPKGAPELPEGYYYSVSWMHSFHGSYYLGEIVKDVPWTGHSRWLHLPTSGVQRYVHHQKALGDKDVMGVTEELPIKIMVAVYYSWMAKRLLTSLMGDYSGQSGT